MNPLKLQCLAAAVTAMFAAGAMADSLLMADTQSAADAPGATMADAARTNVDDAARLKCQTAADQAACLEQQRAGMSDAVPPNSDIDTTTTVDPATGDRSDLGPATAGSPGVSGGETQY